MQRLGFQAPVDQLVGELVGFALGAGKDDGLFRVVDREQVGEHAGAGAAHLDLEVLDGLRGLALALAYHVHRHRLLEVVAREAFDVGRQGGREQKRLALLGRLLKDGLDGVGKAHAQHLVGLVEHGVLHGTQVEVAALEVVDQAPGRSDDHVGAAAQRVFLGAVGGAAVYRDGGQARAALGELIGDLFGEFTRRSDHDGARQPGALTARLEVLDDGQRVGQGLAGAGAGAADQVLAVQGQRQRLDLNGGGFRNTALSETRRKLGRDQLIKVHL